MDKIVKSGEFTLVYKNWRLRKMNNEEIYEATIRSDFTRKMVAEYDGVTFIKVSDND